MGVGDMAQQPCHEERIDAFCQDRQAHHVREHELGVVISSLVASSLQHLGCDVHPDDDPFDTDRATQER